MRQYASTQLSQLGYKVITAPNGSVALDIIRNNPDIDLLFTDMIMPGGVSGADVTREALGIRPELKCLYTSGFTGEALSNIEAGQQYIGLLSKPYNRLELSQKIRNAIDS